MLFLHEYELTLSDNTVALDTWHYFTPLEVARPLTWLTVGLPVRGMPRYASLLVRADKGYNMGYLDGYVEKLKIYYSFFCFPQIFQAD